MEDDGDLALTMLIKPIIEEFYCPICFNLVKEAYITTCGHNFCKECIFECLNRKHICPCCNKETLRNQLIKNHHLDKLIAMVTIEKEEASKKYFEALIKKGQDVDMPDQPQNGEKHIKTGIKLSPIEELFHRHMKKSLTAYEEYYKNLHTKHEKNIGKLKTEYAEKMAKVQSDKDKIIALQAECEVRIKDLNEGFEATNQLLLSSYDKHMIEFAPSPALLPVPVSIIIPSKDIRFNKIILNSNDTVKDLREVLKERLASIGNPLAGYSPSNIFVLIRRTSDDKPGEEIVLMEDRPIVQYKVEPGSDIALKGDVQLTGDIPKQCFTQAYDKANNAQKMDYYTCKDCKFNWICKPCMETCHKGHQVSVYILDHRPSWACCYCVKNGKCKIVKKK